ncbi:methylenetetrahydrofolate reductase [NAD(P)H] [Xaviernesmea oryzae]|uniref:Methylenetetrahydrofolate reductase n=1 Tax=Xaviernesmea oryzae TaxID=464029 RepID=A0A1Q9AZW5_9HYPH|nr:methylenetetrahydrofolate reductase [NAD(P)H] [Xaviernesmea oryzae]OLP61278.1 methylenetetrahydrofolate reductase [NAD(P)H] [Xaviernesmea oryzae]SEL53279.1 5,10-methylenetetrahydrofolate reductase (NAD(P)) [Xaviernesmea oryzae]
MAPQTLHPARRAALKLSFEFFPPKNEEMESQLLSTAETLKVYAPEFVSVTYGAGGSTKSRSIDTVRKLIAERGLTNTAAHLTCVGASCAEVDAVIEEFLAAGVTRFVALRGDAPGGAGVAYQPHPEGYANAAALVAALAKRGVRSISVSAYPEKHPESADVAADIDMLKRKVDNGATQALTQFFFDNDDFERYLNRVRAAGIDIPVIPGILPINNLTQVMKFAGLCGARVPQVLIDRLQPLDDLPEERFREATLIAAEQIVDLAHRGLSDFHLYTMNRAPLISAVCDLVQFQRMDAASPAA